MDAALKQSRELWYRAKAEKENNEENKLPSFCIQLSNYQYTNDH